MSVLHPIQVVVDRTGLSAHVIRIWEKRYGAVTPERTASNRRLYSEEEIERLVLLKRLSEQGHGIGYIAKLPTERLRPLLADEAELASVPPGAVRVDPDLLRERALAAVHAMNGKALTDVLNEAEVLLGGQGVLQRLVGPLAQEIGQRWRSGLITPAHEHFATGVLHTFLSRAGKPFGSHPRNAPVIVVVTPAGQLHELGAMLASAAAANFGWQVLYLGASLAAADIAGAARLHQAKAVALSIVYPDDDPALSGELRRLRIHLPDTPLIVGGRAASGYRAALEEIGAILSSSLDEFGAVLDRLRKVHSVA